MGPSSIACLCASSSYSVVQDPGHITKYEDDFDCKIAYFAMKIVYNLFQMGCRKMIRNNGDGDRGRAPRAGARPHV